MVIIYNHPPPPHHHHLTSYRPTLPVCNTAYMNHSCLPNTTSLVTGIHDDSLDYGMRAIKTIQPGEELTCDYTLFEYEGGNASILSCQCGAGDGRCLGKVLGFKVGYRVG